MSAYRTERVASVIQRVVGDALTHRLSDPRLSPLTSVTRVEVSGDLQVAKVYVSVLGAEGDGRRTFAALQHARGRIQRTLARRLRARFCPEVRLYLDESLKRAAETIEIINRTMGVSPADADARPDQRPGEDDISGAVE